VALVDLPEDDQRHREVVELAELPVEIDRGLRRLQTIVVAASRERAKGHCEVRVEARLESRGHRSSWRRRGPSWQVWTARPGSSVAYSTPRLA
jgi:hypothetical protein